MAVTKTTTYDGDYTIDTYTGDGVTSFTVPARVSSVSYLIISGGGGGGYGGSTSGGGGGGAGGLKAGTLTTTPGESLYIAVGAGGAGGTSVSPFHGVKGGNSVLGTTTVVGGGYGGYGGTAIYNYCYGGSGGSGGGAGGIPGAIRGYGDSTGNEGANCTGAAVPLGGSGGGGAGAAGTTNSGVTGGAGGTGQANALYGVTLLCNGGLGGTANTFVPPPTYGAGTTYLGNIIGGGSGYPYLVTSGTYTITTRTDFLAKMTSYYYGGVLYYGSSPAASGSTIFIPATVTIDLTGYYSITIPAGVRLASNRGFGGSTGGKIYRGWNGDEESAIKEPTLLAGGNGIRVCGLRLEGPDQVEDMYLEDPVGYPTTHYGIKAALRCVGRTSFEVDNCEIYYWSHAAVDLVTSGTLAVPINIHHNYIHHCHARGYGYGIMVEVGSSALIGGNIFDYTRHAVSTTGESSCNYEACYNIHLGHGNPIGGYHFDTHESGVIGGGTILIHHNTCQYCSLPSIQLRGCPAVTATIQYNIFARSWTDVGDSGLMTIVGYKRCTAGYHITMNNNMVVGVLNNTIALGNE